LTDLEWLSRMSEFNLKTNSLKCQGYYFGYTINLKGSNDHIECLSSDSTNVKIIPLAILSLTDSKWPSRMSEIWWKTHSKKCQGYYFGCTIVDPFGMTVKNVRVLVKKEQIVRMSRLLLWIYYRWPIWNDCKKCQGYYFGCTIVDPFGMTVKNVRVLVKKEQIVRMSRLLLWIYYRWPIWNDCQKYRRFGKKPIVKNVKVITLEILST
jgi:hypothetical protein